MEQNDQPAVDAEAQALQDAQAGYANKARAQAPAQPQKEVETTPLAETAQSASEPDPDLEPVPQADPTPSPQEVLATQLEELRSQVRELKSSNADAATVRKMHGEIGDINRTLKELHAAAKANTPEEVDDLTAALKQAEETAKEYPEIAGPLLAAIKVMQARMTAPKPAEETPQAQPQKAEVTPAPHPSGYSKEQLAAIAALDEVHPDRHVINKSAEYQAWLKAKPPEYQKKVTTSWNPAVVAQPFTDFKAFKAAQKRKQDRLDAAETPQGTPRQAQPSTLSDEEGARIGYERARRKRL